MVTVTQDGTRFTWQGTDADELIQGFSNQDNWIYGGDGEDTLRVGRDTQDNRLFGEDGDDELIGGNGRDWQRSGQRLDGQ